MRFVSAAVAALVAPLVSNVVAADPDVPHGHALSVRKSDTRGDDGPATVLATLAHTHTTERVVLDETSPDDAHFSELLADRATGQSMPLDPRLLGLLRTLARAHSGSRIELVSGFRSPKLNEMLRKKGHHVASHSQHSLGHAVDFRVVLEGAPRALDPAQLEREIRASGWTGGVGTYRKSHDWFVHADVGPNRRWSGE